jgi:hypothetical protein
MKAYGEWRYGANLLYLKLDRDECSYSCPIRFSPSEIILLYSLDKRLGGPQTRHGCYGEEKNTDPAGNQTPIVHPITDLYTD